MQSRQANLRLNLQRNTAMSFTIVKGAAFDNETLLVQLQRQLEDLNKRMGEIGRSHSHQSKPPAQALHQQSLPQVLTPVPSAATSKIVLHLPALAVEHTRSAHSVPLHRSADDSSAVHLRGAVKPKHFRAALHVTAWQGADCRDELGGGGLQPIQPPDGAAAHGHQVRGQ